MLAVRALFIAMATTFLAGCGPGVKVPLPMYTKTTPMSDTAIIACPHVGWYVCNIRRVDGIRVDGVFWIRVSPGSHDVQPTLTNGAVVFFGWSPFVVNARPGHAYEIRFSDVRNRGQSVLSSSKEDFLGNL